MREICLLNDSFPPCIDGVANTVMNYASVMHSKGQPVSVVVPEFPGADDSGFSYPVIRYPSVDLRGIFGYMAGNPFNVPTLGELAKRDIGILHCHCPVMSCVLARELRSLTDAPLILTYHTKFDIDIANAISNRLLREGAVRALVDNLSGCDELWAVSRGAGENVKSLGYQGDYIVMKNGVDVPRGRASDSEVAEAVRDYDLPEGVPVFLFVGRIMWYKGLRLILDALAALDSRHRDFRMVFIGGGGDEQQVKDCTAQLGLGGKVIYTGPIRDRRRLAAWYTRADLFLFPSTYDTNGLVVREAAACSLASVLIAGSCASEDITDGVNGLLIEENAPSLAACLEGIMENKDAMRRIGERAAEEIYFSWEDAVAQAQERYEIVLDNYRSGKYRRSKVTPYAIGKGFKNEIGAFWSGMVDIINTLTDNHSGGWNGDGNE